MNFSENIRTLVLSVGSFISLFVGFFKNFIYSSVFITILIALYDVEIIKNITQNQLNWLIQLSFVSGLIVTVFWFIFNIEFKNLKKQIDARPVSLRVEAEK